MSPLVTVLLALEVFTAGALVAVLWQRPPKPIPVVPPEPEPDPGPDLWAKHMERVRFHTTDERSISGSLKLSHKAGVLLLGAIYHDEGGREINLDGEFWLPAERILFWQHITVSA